MSEIETTTTPITVGAKLTVKIHDIAFGGEGVGRVNEFVVFVPFVLVGEEVEVEITEVKKNFARAKLCKVIKSSSERVEPQCPHFGACGGCQYQHMDYSAQLRFKHKQIADLFQRIGGFSQALVDPVVPCPNPYHYRNRIMVRSQWNKPLQKLDIGFLRYDSRLVVDLHECKIAEPALNEQIQLVRKNPPPKGGLKVVLRIMPEGWEVPRDSFFQNNFFLLPKLVEAVRNRFADSGNKFLIDAYCGVGFFSIEMADLAERFAGVEIDAMAIKSARKNATQRNITNGEYVMGDTTQLLPSLLQRFESSKTTVVLDPPRTGCSPESLQLLRDVRPAQIIYVSCHPATLARDLNILCAEGVFELAKVVPLDMFPQTQHVECVADLRLKNKSLPEAGSSAQLSQPS
ncbi:MAG: methyltransferase, TrmA family [Verrucomicrobiales bacterium]|nr:methyltransferase, TrmA family [Verrucomicrobiales bacterium]